MAALTKDCEVVTVGPARTRFFFPRTPLLIEIERRCAGDTCGATNRIGLTKAEVIEYRGFECSQCERWNDDELNQLELPDSWISPTNESQVN